MAYDMRRLHNAVVVSLISGISSLLDETLNPRSRLHTNFGRTSNPNSTTTHGTVNDILHTSPGPEVINFFPAQLS